MHKQVIVVGAGPAGIGCSLALQRAGVRDVILLEAKEIGASFRAWPQEMRFITPSFYANPFFQTDLNSISPETSPADFFQKEHLSGQDYADYLNVVVQHFDLEVREGSRVQAVQPLTDTFVVKTDDDALTADCVIWASGEFSHAKIANFTGAEHCVHSSFFKSWQDYPGEDALIIGGYESGIDAAFNLVNLGKRVLLLSSGEPWLADSPDPSEVLSPYTRDRLLTTVKNAPDRLRLRGNAVVTSVNALPDRFVVETSDGELFDCPHPPIAATGFHSALKPVQDLFEWDGSTPQFTDEDASTLHQGLYYSGPSLVQKNSKFCFIYKFRARFGVIARAIAARLSYPEPDMMDDRRRGFLVDDLECCTNCECAVDSQAEEVPQPTDIESEINN
jgi:cation diffusion facilitator CzcD-associated flavoprotein CzcO